MNTIFIPGQLAFFENLIAANTVLATIRIDKGKLPWVQGWLNTHAVLGKRKRQYDQLGIRKGVKLSNFLVNEE